MFGKLALVRLGLALVTLQGCLCTVTLTRDMKTIATAKKSEAYAAGSEFVLWEHVLKGGNSAVITEQWFAIFGGNQPYDPNPDVRVRVYIDGEVDPSLDFMLFMAHGISPQACNNISGTGGTACSDPHLHRTDDVNVFSNTVGSGWATTHMGHGSNSGALKNTFRIPFGRSIKITMWMPQNGIVYYYARGMTNYPLIVGDLQLPKDARLHLHKNDRSIVSPTDFLALVPKRNSSGLLYQVTLAGSSDYIGFMEGCVRAWIDDASAPLLLSSGTEDYFEGANFFDAGLYKSDQAGVTFLSGTNPGPYAMSAYKFHIRDPVVWWDSFELTTRNYDTYGCALAPSPTPLLQPVEMSSYAWTYEWASESVEVVL